MSQPSIIAQAENAAAVEREGKLSALKCELERLKKTNKELRQRLTRDSQVDRNKLVNEIADWVDNYHSYLGNGIRDEFRRDSV